MNFWTGKQDDKEFEKERNRLLKEWEELHQKRQQKDWSKEVTKELDKIYKKREGWYD